MTFDYQARHNLLRRWLKAHRLHATLVNSLVNIRYLTGFTGSAAALLVKPQGLYLYVDFRYFEQAHRECHSGCHIVEWHDRTKSWWTDMKAGLKGKQVGFESGSVTYEEYLKLQKELLKLLRKLKRLW